MTLTITPAMDDTTDTTALRKLLSDCLVSVPTVDHVVDKGCTTIATMAHAVGDPDQLDAFIQHIILVPEGESFQQFTPQTARLRRAVKEVW